MRDRKLSGLGSEDSMRRLLLDCKVIPKLYQQNIILYRLLFTFFHHKYSVYRDSIVTLFFNFLIFITFNFNPLPCATQTKNKFFFSRNVICNQSEFEFEYFILFYYINFFNFFISLSISMFLASSYISTFRRVEWQYKR